MDTHFHDARFGNIITTVVVIIESFGASLSFLAIVGAPLPLEPRSFILDALNAHLALSHSFCLHIVKYISARNFEAAFATGCHGPRPMTLDEFLRQDSGVTFKVVNVLCVIRQELAFFLE